MDIHRMTTALTLGAALAGGACEPAQPITQDSQVSDRATLDNDLVQGVLHDLDGLDATVEGSTRILVDSQGGTLSSTDTNGDGEADQVDAGGPFGGDWYADRVQRKALQGGSQWVIYEGHRSE